MPLTIEQYFECNKNLGNYESARVGLSIKSDAQLTDPAEVEKLSNKLLTLAKSIVNKQLEAIKQTKES